MSNIKQALEDNQVLLWGLKKVDEKTLKPYDKGNKNPQSMKRQKTEGKYVKRTEKPKEPEKPREYEPNTEYFVNDLPFLNKEYDRISDYLDKGEFKDDDEYNLYIDLQDKLYETISELEEIKEKFYKTGKGLEPDDVDDEGDDEPDITDGKNKIELQGGTIEKKRKTAMKKDKLINIIGQAVKQEAKVRYEKGSEQAKEVGKRLAEARKAKKALKATEEAEKKKKEQEEKQKKKDEKEAKKKPWFYIGDYPRGYREATETEAIRAGKVSEYGKYKVDNKKYDVYTNYRILVSENEPSNIMAMNLRLAEKKGKEALNKIEIYETKVENPKYKDKKEEFQDKLDQAIDDYNTINWAYKTILSYYNKKFGKDIKIKDITLPPKPIIQPLTEEESQKSLQKLVEMYKPPEKIDPRTGKPISDKDALSLSYIKEQMAKKPDEWLEFKRGEHIISLKKKYFNKDFELKPKYAKALFEKNILLLPNFYNEDDKLKYFYQKHGSGLYDMLSSSFNYLTNSSYYLPYIPKLDLFYDPENFTNKAKDALKQIGDKQIKAITIQRSPVQQYIKDLINIVSLGEFNKRFGKTPYDNLFHLKLIMTTTDNTNYSIEKNEVVNISINPKNPEIYENNPVLHIPNINLNTMINNYMTQKGKKAFFEYDGVKNNCQDFALNLLKCSNMGSQEDYMFIKQDLDDCFQGLKTLERTMKYTTDIGARITGLLGGRIVPRIPDTTKKEIVQTILFDKNMWTPEKAKEWLKEHNYYNDDIDTKKTVYRARQYNPEDLKNNRYYITKRIKNKGIELVISMLRVGKNKPIKIIDTDDETSSDDDSVSGGALMWNNMNILTDTERTQELIKFLAHNFEKEFNKNKKVEEANKKRQQLIKKYNKKRINIEKK